MTDPPNADQVFRDEVLPEMDAVFRYALRLAGDPERAQDLTQDTFLRAFRNRDAYTPGTRPRSWLFTICRNLFLKAESRARRHHEIMAEVTEEDPRRISREATVFMEARNRDPEGAFWDRMVDEEILRAIEALPPEYREPVVLSDLEDLSYEEIAQILGIPLGTVKSRLFRGRRTLQERLYDYAVSTGLLEPEAHTEGSGRDGTP